MEKFTLKQISSLEKVLLTDTIDSKKSFDSFSALLGEVFSYQIVYKGTDADKRFVHFSFDSPLKKYIRVYDAKNIPFEHATHCDVTDDDFITHEPGMIPDALLPLEEGEMIFTRETRSLWVSVSLPKKLKSGIYPISFTFTLGEETETITFNLEAIPCPLPEQKTLFTQWFHGDCIADFHGVRVFSKKHWSLMEKYVKLAVESGINMILTPVITPPLDIDIGGERTTIQLVDVFKNKNKYSFDFSKLSRWIKMCRKCGIKYFEISHLFSQWGAKYSPKIMATVDGEYKRIFGWDVEADSKEYKAFLDAFLPELDKFLTGEGVKDITYFHTSDEPNDKQLEGYTFASSMLKKHLVGYHMMDAVSHIEYAELVETPVVSIDFMHNFIDHKVTNAWVYTSCWPPNIYSNRFITMPSGRTRIIGTMMYKYKIPGYLHWGFNFYNSQLSKRHINPYITSDGDGSWPAGDPFSVYPYGDGATHSIRSRVFYDALQDIRTFELAESFIGHEAVVGMIEKYGKITFPEYPRDYDNILKIKKDIHKLIKENLK